MQTITTTIVNKRGLHARAAMKFVELARQYPCEVQVGTLDSQLVDGKNILSLMLLAAGQGKALKVQASGEQSTQALTALQQLISAGFDEED